MIDREKVIKEFEHLLNVAKDNYQDFVDLTVDGGEEILALLKEQEAVRPILTPWTVNDDGEVTVYKMECGKCGIQFYYEDQKYCSECGTPILWGGR